MKVYVIKYALTRGTIFATEAEIGAYGHPVIQVDERPVLLNKADWAPDRESAIIKAERMRRVKIKDLERHLKKTKKLKIEVHEWAHATEH